MYNHTGTHLGHLLLPASPEGMTESCSPSWNAMGGPTSQAPMTTTDTSGSKDGPDTSHDVPGYKTHQQPTEATPNMRPSPRSDEW